MVRLATRKQKVDSLNLLYEIEIKVERFQKAKKKADRYRDMAEKMKREIFNAFDEIPKPDFALHSEKIARITKRLNNA